MKWSTDVPLSYVHDLTFTNVTYTKRHHKGVGAESLNTDLQDFGYQGECGGFDEDGHHGYVDRGVIPRYFPLLLVVIDKAASNHPCCDTIKSAGESQCRYPSKDSQGETDLTW